MFPPIAQVVSGSAAVKALLGTKPIRFWSFGEAPRNVDGTPAGGTPYAVWQTVYGSPENYLSCTPDVDSWGTQIDVYGSTAHVVRGVAEALRDAFETVAYVVSWNGESKDDTTGLFQLGFTVEWITPR